MSYDTAWGDCSLVRLQERLAAPLVQHPEPVPPPAPTPPRDPLLAAGELALRFQAAVWNREPVKIRQAARGLGSMDEAVALALILAEAIGVDATALRLVTLAVAAEVKGAVA